MHFSEESVGCHHTVKRDNGTKSYEPWTSCLLLFTDCCSTELPYLCIYLGNYTSGALHGQHVWWGGVAVNVHAFCTWALDGGGCPHQLYFRSKILCYQLNRPLAERHCLSAAFGADKCYHRREPNQVPQAASS